MLSREVTERNIQVKENSGIEISNYVPPKGVKSKDLEKLVEICLRLDDNYTKQIERSQNLAEMARLARAGKKDTEEFKKLDFLYKHPTVIDSSNEYVELHRIMKKFRK